MTDSDAILSLPPMRALLRGAIDYAGLFPPASLDVATVAANYAQYRAGPDGWALGRLVIPVAKLDALAAVAAARAGTGTGAGAAGRDANDAVPWRLSALAGPDARGDAERIAAFNQAHGTWAIVDSVESRAGTVAEIMAMHGLFAGMLHFVEIPVTIDLAPVMRALREIGAMAKIRTGGVSAEAFPAARDVARFLRACADAEVAFKATAGLHHPLRGAYSLTYEPNAARGVMFGYLNVLLAAAQARAGASVDALIATLEEAHHDFIGITGEEVRWEGGEATTAMVDDLRRRFALAFGSCSFREPLDEIGILHSS